MNEKDREAEREHMITKLLEDIDSYKNTIDNLNFTIEFLKESNKQLSYHLSELDDELDRKSIIFSSFLDKHNFSMEDIIEHENEIKINESNEPN